MWLCTQFKRIWIGHLKLICIALCQEFHVPQTYEACLIFQSDHSYVWMLPIVMICSPSGSCWSNNWSDCSWLEGLSCDDHLWKCLCSNKVLLMPGIPCLIYFRLFSWCQPYIGFLWGNIQPLPDWPLPSLGRQTFSKLHGCNNHLCLTLFLI